MSLDHTPTHSAEVRLRRLYMYFAVRLHQVVRTFSFNDTVSGA